MTVLPVIERELRAQSRLPFTYGLRVIGALATLMVCVFFALFHPMSHGLGGELFALLNCTVFFSIWILAPMLCADCISRERREGTVGLLFLTPLRARDVVLAKSLVHGLRALALLLAVLPVMTIALLLGGVSWLDMTLSLIMNFNSLCWALAAGLFASSMSKTWVRSQLLAFLFVAFFGFGFLMLVGLNVIAAGGSTTWASFYAANNFDRSVAVGFLAATNYDQWWDKVISRAPRSQMAWVFSGIRMTIISVGFLCVVTELAAWNLRRFWREEPPSAGRMWLEKKLTTPVLMVSFLRSWMRRKLERNPIGWLEARTWSGRLVTWGWFAVMISVYSAALSNADVNRSLDILQRFMAWLLLGIVAVSASGSFQRERETGVLELLLVSPMRIGQIIGGRLRGLWGQFLPALLLLLGIWAFLSTFFPARRGTGVLIEFFCGAFLTLPVIGLYYSLRRGTFISAFLSTVFVGLAVPYGIQLALNSGAQFLLGMNVFYLVGLSRPEADDSLGTLLIYALLRLIWLPYFVTLFQLIVAAWLGRRLYRDMAQRNFAFTRAAT